MNSNDEYHIQSHLFRELEADSRYEVIVQTRNSFGWSRPTASFIFSTRDKGRLDNLVYLIYFIIDILIYVIIKNIIKIYPYIFADYSPMNVASHPSLRGGLISAAVAPMSQPSKYCRTFIVIVLILLIFS